VIVVLNLFDIISGKETDYARYLRGVKSILDRHGAKILSYGRTRQVYMGDALQEYCGMVCYPDMATLKRFSDDPEFVEIRPLRDDSTRNYILTVIEDFPSIDNAASYLESTFD
jgi:uncharacterized protein (DUF1330 family)